MEINEEWFEEGEPIMFFDNIQIAYLEETKSRTNARGGTGNQVFIKWEDTKGMDIQLSEGVVSKMGLSLLSNSKIFSKKSNIVPIPYTEKVESYEEDGNWYLSLRHKLLSAPYVYKNGIKITDFRYRNEMVGNEEKGKILINEKCDESSEYYVYYEYEYTGQTENLQIGQRLVKGFLSLTGRMRIKDDQSGKETTCLVEIPKVELMSDLTLRLGSEVSPALYNFYLRAHPVGDRGNQYVCKITLLDKDIDSDI